MIPVEMVYILITLAAGLSIYAVWHLDNRIYANIVLGGFTSSVLWFFLAANIITGNVFADVLDGTSTVIDIPLFWLFVMFGLAMTVYSLALAVEAIMEGNVKDIGAEG